MAFSGEDLDAIEQAVVALGCGRRVVEVMHGNRRATYQQSDLEKLRALRLEMIQQTRSTKTGHVVVSTSKGL